MKILREWNEGNYLFKEYTEDGKNVSVTVKSLITDKSKETHTPTFSDKDKLNYLYYKATGVIS